VGSATNVVPEADATKLTAGLIQSLPTDVSLTSITARFAFGDDATYAGSTHITAQLWTGPADASTLSPVSGAGCAVALGTSQHLSGTVVSCSAPLDVDLAAGTVAIIGVTIDNNGFFSGSVSTSLSYS
jgi:hypothetical protein